MTTEEHPPQDTRRCEKCHQQIRLKKDRTLTLTCGCELESPIKVASKLPGAWQ